MEKLMLLILEAPGRAEERGIRGGIDRIRTLNDIVSLGGKVRHDSGERLIVIDTAGLDEGVLQERLTGARLVSLDEDIEALVPDLGDHEELFLEALRIRTSSSYRRMKKRQKPGESPEEKELFSAPCTPEV